MAKVDSDWAYRGCISEAKADGIRPFSGQVAESDVLESISPVIESGETQGFLERHWDT